MYYASTYVRLSFSLHVSYRYKNLVPIFFSCHFCDNPIRNSISVFRGLCTRQWIASHRKMNLIFNQDIKSLFWKRYQTCIKRWLHVVLFFPSRLSKSSVGPVTPLPIGSTNWPDDLYAIKTTFCWFRTII